MAVNTNCLSNSAIKFNCCDGCGASLAKTFCGSTKSLGLLNNQVEETYGGHVVVKVSTTKKVIKKYLKKKMKNYTIFGRKAQFISAIIMPLMNFIKNLGYVFVAVLGGVKVANGMMDLGDVKHFFNIPINFHNRLLKSLI